MVIHELTVSGVGHHLLLSRERGLLRLRNTREGKMKKGLPIRVFIGSLLILIGLGLTVIPGASGAPVAFENLTQDIGRGFGDNWNRYAWSMQEFDGDVYVGTWSAQLDYAAILKDIGKGEITDASFGNVLTGIKYIKSTGGEIWRYTDDQTWERVLDASKKDTGFREMVEYNGKLYAGTQNSQGTNLYCSSDGGNWIPLDGGPMGNKDNISIRTMLEYNGKLYVGTENNVTGGELWTYDGLNWTQQGVGQFDGDASVAELAVHDGDLYVGTWDFSNSYKLFKSDAGGDNFSDVTPVFQGSSELSNLGVMMLQEFNDEFYLGTVNYTDGFTLLRTPDPADPEGWDVITTDGLGDPSNAYAWSSVVWNDELYLGTFNDGLYGGIYDPLPVPLDGRAQLWRSSDGLQWSEVVDDGFGSAFNYGIRTMTVADDRLFVGTASNFLIPDPATLNANTLRTLMGGDLEGIDLSYLRTCLSSIPTGNWIGTEVWASQPGSAPVPEPATLLLLGSGLLALAGFGRKKIR